MKMERFSIEDIALAKLFKYLQRSNTSKEAGGILIGKQAKGREELLICVMFLSLHIWTKEVGFLLSAIKCLRNESSIKSGMNQMVYFIVFSTNSGLGKTPERLTLTSYVLLSA